MGRERKYEGVRADTGSTITIDFRYAGRRCKERIKLEPTPANLKRAAQHRAAILLAIENGTFDYATTFPNSKRAKLFAKTPEPAGLHVSSFLDTWLEDKKEHTKASTWDGYRKIVNNVLIPALGKIELKDLSRSDVKTMLKGKKCSNKRLINIQSVLRSALDDAVLDEHIEVNPIKEWVYTTAEAPKRVSDVDPFTKEEQALILAHCVGQFRNLVQFALWTGLRTSELIALDWSDIDWRRGVIIVSKALTQVADEVEDTKTFAGLREVKLLPPAMMALDDQKRYTLDKGQEIFQDPRHGERWAGDMSIRQCFWQQTLTEAGVRYRRPYQTRHTYASMLLSAGENPMWVATQMGHTDLSMLKRTYGKWMPDADPTAGNMAVSLFAGTQEKVDQKVDQTTLPNPTPPYLLLT